MPHDVRKLLQDMRGFIKQLEQFLGAKSLDQLEQDQLHLRAVEMQFVLVAEVLRRLEQVSPEIEHRVSNIRQIAGMRNKIIHDYDEVDTEIIHAAATLNVPILKQQVDAWAEELGMAPTA